MSAIVQKMKRFISERDQKKLNSIYLVDEARHKVFADEHEDPFIHTESRGLIRKRKFEGKEMKATFCPLGSDF